MLAMRINTIYGCNVSKVPAARIPNRYLTIRAMVNFAILTFSIFIAGLCSAAVITYTATSSTPNRWTYQYEISTAATDATIEEFTIFFDYSLYANINVDSSPSGWDTLAVQPDVNLSSDGFIDSLALVGGLTPGSSIAGFAVSFDYLGNGTPGSQRYDIVDPVNFALVDSGVTQASPVSEPTTALLMGFLIPVLLIARRVGSKHKPPLIASCA